MTSPFAFPVLGLSLLAAVLGGVHLGESAIGLINPIHFQGPIVHPRDRGVAIEEPVVTARAPAFHQLYGWEEGHAARAADCGDCEALAARDRHAYSAEVPWFGPEPDRPAEAAADVRFAEEVPAPDARSRIHLYAHFPVESEPAPVGAKEIALELLIE